MAQKKISELTAVVLASGSAVLPIVQDGTTSKITFANLTGSILNVATAVTASHALTALSASYAVSASHEITYELSSSFAETTTSASHALTSNTAISASYALTASHALNANIETGQFAVTGSNTFIGNQIIDGTVTATTFTGSFIGDGSGLTEVTASRLYKAIAPIYVGTQENDSLGTTEMAGDSITIRSNDDTSSTPLYRVSNTGGTKLGVFGLQPGTGEVYLSAFNGGLNLLSTTGIIKASGSLDIRDSLIVRSGASGSFSGSFTGNGAGLTGVTAVSASYAVNALTASYAPPTPAPLKGSANLGVSFIDYYSDPSTLKRDNLVIHHSPVEIGIPLASNFTLGTVVEFDIYIPTGSYFQLRTKDSSGNTTAGFMIQGGKGFNQVDFNPQFNDWFGTYKQFGYTGFFNSINSSFGDITGDNSHNGPALLRLVALSTSYDSASPVTPASNLFGNLWAVRIISRMPMSNSPGTNLAVEIVTALPYSGNSVGDLVIFNAGSGNKLHFYNGTGWDQL